MMKDVNTIWGNLIKLVQEHVEKEGQSKVNMEDMYWLFRHMNELKKDVVFANQRLEEFIKWASDNQSKLKHNEEEACKHKKVFSGMMYSSNPPQFPWRCSECGFKGIDRGTYERSKYTILPK